MAGGPPEKPDQHLTNPADDSKRAEKPAAPDSSSGALAQSELDDLISSLKRDDAVSQDADNSAQDQPPEKDQPETIRQSDMDSLIASIVGEQDEQSIEVEADAPMAAEAESHAAEVTVENGHSRETSADVAPLIGQDELDVLLKNAKPKTSRFDIGSGSQVDTDALLASIAEGAAPPAAESPRLTKSAEEMVASALLSQEELDALFESARSGRETASAASDDSLSGESSEAEQEPADKSPLLSQEDLDALLAHADSETPVPQEETLPEEQEDEEAFSASSPLLSQEDLDALLAQMNASEETETQKPPAEEAGAENEFEALNQDDMDALIRQMTGAGPDEPEEEGDVTDRADMDTLLAQVDKSLSVDTDDLTDKVGEDLKSLVQGGDPNAGAPPDVEPQPDDAEKAVESLTEEELDSVLSGEDVERPLDDKPLDAVLPESQEESPSDMDAVLDAASAQMTQAADTPDTSEPPTSEEAVSDSDTEEMDALLAAITQDESVEDGGDVGSENLAAAGTVQEREDTGDAAQDAIDAILKKSPGSQKAPAAPKSTALGEPAHEAPPDTTPTTKRSRKRIALPRVSPSLLAKTGLSLAAGVVFGFTSYSFLSNYQTRSPELVVPNVARTLDLEQVVARANALLDAGDYAGAWRTLEGPVREAPPSPLRTEAEAARIEAAYRSLPSKVSEFEVELVNSYIDSFLMHAPSHARAPEILLWKADLYERVDIPFAAYDVYDQLLKGYEDVANRPELLLRAGKLAQKIGRYNEAETHLAKLVNTYPGAPQAAEGKLLLGETLVRQGRQEEGQALLTQIAEAYAHSRLGAEAYAALGRLAFDRGDYQAAIDLLNRRMKSGTTSEGNDKILLMLAEGYRATNRMQEAQDALRDIIRFFPDSESAPQAYIELTELLDRQGRRDDALRIASEAVQEHASEPDVLLQYARIRELAGDTHGAAQALLAAEEAGVADPQVLLTAGNQFLKAGYIREARQTFERIAGEFPGTSQAVAANVELAKLAFEEGQTQAALGLLQNMAQVAEATPQETEVLLALGDMYRDLGLTQRAAQAYRDVAAESSEPNVLARAAMALYSAEAWSEGNEVARRVDVARLNPSTAYDFLMDYGQAMLRADSKRAVTLMEQAQSQYPEERDMPGAGRLVDAYLALDQLENAVTLTESMLPEVELANAEDFRKMTIACGDYAMDHADYPVAVKAYETAIEVNDRETQQSQWAKYQLANALYAQGKEDESRSLLQSVAASANFWATDAQLRLDYINLRGRLTGEVPAPPETEG